jgi:REP element-mobilizing transposase RayT
VIYHLIGRVVDRGFRLQTEEKEQFRMLMRMMENFSGCRVLSYCVMSNHYHILLEVPPMPKGGLPAEEVFRRLRVLYSETRVAEVEAAYERAQEQGPEDGGARVLEEFTYRMHDLSEFMKGLLQRFTSWFNRTHDRTGRLWEQRFKSVLVEEGVAAKAMAAYIDLNPVRAGIVEDPADYRWSSYAEALAGGKKARAGLVRALRVRDSDLREDSAAGEEDGSFASEKKRIAKGARRWAQGGYGKSYRALLLGKGVEKKIEARVVRKGMSAAKAEQELASLAGRSTDVSISKMIRHRVRYFSDGVAVGGRDFVDEVFLGCRERFGPRRTSGARKPRGALGQLAGKIWTARDLRGEG